MRIYKEIVMYSRRHMVVFDVTISFVHMAGKPSLAWAWLSTRLSTSRRSRRFLWNSGRRRGRVWATCRASRRRSKRLNSRSTRPRRFMIWTSEFGDSFVWRSSFRCISSQYPTDERSTWKKSSFLVYKICSLLSEIRVYVYMHSYVHTITYIYTHTFLYHICKINYASIYWQTN